MRLRSRQRLRSQADFAAVRKEGRRQFGAAFVFSVPRREAQACFDLPRFAVVASRRVGGAVVRNRLKRQMRAIFREHQQLFPAELDVVVTLRDGASRATFEELRAAFLSSARRAGFGGEAKAPPPPKVGAPDA